MRRKTARSPVLWRSSGRPSHYGILLIKPGLGRLLVHVHIPGEVREVEQLPSARRRGTHEALKRQLVSDTRQASHIALDVGLKIRAEEDVPRRARVQRELWEAAPPDGLVEVDQRAWPA